MSRRYAKGDLEEIVSIQLENLNAIHDLLSIMKHQNELLEKANKKLKDEVSDFKQKTYPKLSKRRAGWKRSGRLYFFGCPNYLGGQTCKDTI